MKLQYGVQIAEIITSIAIVLTLIVLAIEINQNTSEIQRQVLGNRFANFSNVFFTSSEVSKIHAKVKAIDGTEPVQQAFMDRYELTPEEAVIWSRLVQNTWFELHIDYQTYGPSKDIADTIRNLWKYPDVQIAFGINEDSFLTPEFVTYAQTIINEM